MFRKFLKNCMSFGATSRFENVIHPLSFYPIPPPSNLIKNRQDSELVTKETKDLQVNIISNVHHYFKYLLFLLNFLIHNKTIDIILVLSGGDDETKPQIGFRILVSKLQSSKSTSYWNYVLKTLILFDRIVEA